MRDLRLEICGGDDCQTGGEDDGAALIAEPVRVGHPVAQRGAERLREQDRYPIEYLDPGVATVLTVTDPSDQRQMASEAISPANRIDDPPK